MGVSLYLNREGSKRGLIDKGLIVQYTLCPTAAIEQAEDRVVRPIGVRTYPHTNMYTVCQVWLSFSVFAITITLPLLTRPSPSIP